MRRYLENGTRYDWSKLLLMTNIGSCMRFRWAPTWMTLDAFELLYKNFNFLGILRHYGRPI